jgi:hypothetical protein
MFKLVDNSKSGRLITFFKASASSINFCASSTIPNSPVPSNTHEHNANIERQQNLEDYANAFTNNDKTENSGTQQQNLGKCINTLSPSSSAFFNFSFIISCVCASGGNNTSVGSGARGGGLARGCGIKALSLLKASSSDIACKKACPQ